MESSKIWWNQADGLPKLSPAEASPWAPGAPGAVGSRPGLQPQGTDAWWKDVFASKKKDGEEVGDPEKWWFLMVFDGFWWLWRLEKF